MSLASWPSSWPAEVRDLYAAVAHERGWDDTVVDAITASAEHIRALSDSDRARQHFSGRSQGAEWFFETVQVQDEHVVIRQSIIDDDGRTQHYAWDRLEDADGGLTDVALDPAHVQRISEVEFVDAWRRSG